MKMGFIRSIEIPTDYGLCFILPIRLKQIKVGLPCFSFQLQVRRTGRRFRRSTVMPRCNAIGLG